MLDIQVISLFNFQTCQLWKIQREENKNHQLSHMSVITTVNVLMHSVLLLFFPFSIYTYIFLLRSCRSHQTYSSALLCDTMMTWANHKPSLLLIPWQVLPTGRLRKKLEDGRLVKGIASLSSLFYQLHFT